MLSLYRIQRNIIKKRSKKVSNTNLDNNSHRELDLKGHQLTSSELVKPETKTESFMKRTSFKKNKKFREAGYVQESIEINDKYLDEIPHIKNL